MTNLRLITPRWPLALWPTCIAVGFVYLFLAPPAHSLTSIFPSQGNPNGLVHGWFRFFDGSGSSPENSANYHVCSNPAYSASNFIEMDGSLGGATGTPSWVAGSRSEIPSLDFTRANGHYVRLLDNSAGCTTGNDPWDNAIGNDDGYSIGAWVKPEMGTLTCAGTPVGTKYMVASKWDGVSSCSYQLWLEVVDINGGGCVDADLRLRAKARFNDAGATFSCATPCELPQNATNLDLTKNNGWAYVGFFLASSSTTSTAEVNLNAKEGVSRGSAGTCVSGTSIPEPVDVDNNTQDLFIGIDKAGGTDGFEGKIGSVKIAMGSSAASTTLSLPLAVDSNFLRTQILSHFDSDYAGTAVAGADGGLEQFGLRQPSGSGPTYSSTARYGNSLHFDGIDDRFEYTTGVTVETTPLTTNSLRVEAWIRATDADGGGTKTQTIISKWQFNDDAGCTDNTSNSAYRLFLTTAGKVAFSVMDGVTSGVATATGTTVLADNTWYHVGGIVTSVSPFQLTSVKVYVMLDGKDDTGGAPAALSSGRVKPGPATIMLGTTPITNPGTTCSTGPAKDYFDGYVDEVRVAVPQATFISPADSQVGESFNPGIAINEVNFFGSNEKIELYIFPNLGHSLNLDGWGLMGCNDFVTNTSLVAFDDACGNCGGAGSKVVDPGDIVTISSDLAAGPTDTSCSGAATTCTWYTFNSATALHPSGNFLSMTDGLVLLGKDAALVTTQTQANMESIGGLIWGSDTGNCNSLYSPNTGAWPLYSVLSTGLVTSSAKSVCLISDGNDVDGTFSWRVCNDTMGALNSSTTTAIELQSWDVKYQSDGNHLSWQTGSETNVLGFNILRSDEEFGGYAIINSELIASSGGPFFGANYAYLDTAGEPKQCYILQEIEVDGMTREYGPVCANRNPTTKDDGDAEGLGSDGVSDSAGGDMPLGASGCGRIVATDSTAGPSLSFLLLLIIYLSTRTTWISDRLLARAARRS